MKTPKAPATPDPNAVSAAQTQSNRETAAFQNALDHGNTTTPWGSQSFTGRVDPTTGATVYDQSISLSPEQQQLYDQQQQQNLQLGQTSSNMLSSVQDAYRRPMDTSSLPALNSGVNMSGAPGIKSSYTTVGPQMEVDRSNLSQLYGSDDLMGARKQVQDALYDQNAAYLDKDYARSQDQLRTRLANQGVVEGTEAYSAAMDDYNRGREMAYRQARNESITRGGDEMSRLSGIARDNRGQLYNENLSSGNFRNSAAAQATGQNATAAGFSNTARGQQLSEELARAQFGNDARSQGLQEQTALRNQPLNEFNALRSATQVDTPQFQNPNTATIAPTDTAGNIWNAYNGQLGIYNAQAGGNNAMMGGLMGLAGNLGSAWIASDRRVKSKVKRLGLLPQGVGFYEFEYTDDPKHEKQRGVMAQEVERDDPESVATGRDGVKKVNYKRVLARALAEAA